MAARTIRGDIVKAARSLDPRLFDLAKHDDDWVRAERDKTLEANLIPDGPPEGSANSVRSLVVGRVQMCAWSGGLEAYGRVQQR